jgi:hypothetical protein
MSRSWNGESLVDELSALLGDTSTAYKSRVLGWANDVIFDISSRHDWAHHLVKGKKVLVSGEEEHSLEIDAPEAPSVALYTGTGLTASSFYKVLITYLQDNGAESVAGTESAALTASGANLQINVTNIPTSLESLVTKRNVYLQKDNGPFYLYQTIEDNFTIDLIITDDADSTIEPPDYGIIRRLKGSPFFEGAPSNYLTYKDVDQLRLMAQGAWSTGSPSFFSPLDVNNITVYPIPSSDMEVSFNYYRNPKRLFNSTDSQPDLPIYLKPTLKAGIIALGFEYRDRAGQEIKRANYENSLVDAINRGGRVSNIEYTVRDVYGSFNGYEVL